MFKHKKLFLTCTVISALLSSSATFANTIGPCTDCYKGLPVLVPNLRPGFELNAAVLWLQPGASNLNYVIYNKELPAPSPTWKEQEIYPSFTAGFEVGARYILPCEGQDIRVNWSHLDTNDSDSISADNVNYFLGPDYEIGPAGIPIRNAHGKAKFMYDVVNLDFGQHVDFGPHVTMRFFGGLSASRLREEVFAYYSGTTLDAPIGPFYLNQNVTSTFTGVGPRFGINANYKACYGFGFFGEGAFSALIGSLQTKTNYAASAPLSIEAGVPNNSQWIKDQRVFQVIPGLDARLGIDYRYLVNNCVLLKVEAGYQAAVYINAISQYLPNTLVTPLETGGIFVATMGHRLSNYSVQGPYLNFAVQF